MKKLFILKILLLSVACQQNIFTVKENRSGKGSVGALLLKVSKVNDKLQCVVQCNKAYLCLSAVFWRTAISPNCFLYRKYLSSSDFSVTNGSDCYWKSCDMVTTLNDTSCVKKGFSFMRMFDTYTSKFNISSLNGVNLGTLCGFEEMFSGNKWNYYLLSCKNTSKVTKLSETWEFQLQKDFDSPFHAKAVGNKLFITSDICIYKTDENLNVLIQYNGSYRGIFCDQKTSLIYTAAVLDSRIDVFNLELTLVKSLTFSTYIPFSINSYNGLFYIGTTQGQILVVFQNSTILNVLATPCEPQHVTKIEFDYFGFMIYTCMNSGFTPIHYTFNGSFTGKSMSSTAGAIDWKIDSKGRIIRIENMARIYY